MEDIALSATLKRVAGPPACLRSRAVTSGRRWDAHGALRTIVTMWRLRYAYWRGADPQALADRYRRPTARALPRCSSSPRSRCPGQVKTRLAATIGAPAAASVYTELAERTLAAAVAARAAGIVGAVELWCDPAVDRPAFVAWRDRYDLALHAQRGADLGARMHGALAAALAQGAPALLVGTDCPGLDVAYLARAAATLAGNDAVLGPADDGGYVLIGLRARSRPLQRHRLEHRHRAGRHPRAVGDARRDVRGAAAAVGRGHAGRPRPLSRDAGDHRRPVKCLASPCQQSW